MSLLVIFARPPIPGKTKTRLIPRFGKIGACRIYCRALNHVLHLANQSKFSEIEIHTPEPFSHPALQRLAKFHQCKLKPQVKGNLGRKMAAVFRARVNAPLAIVGADCVGISINTLNKIAEQLDSKSVLFVPADDGGYVLVGGSRVPSAVFHRIDWGSKRVLRQTLRRCEQVGIACRTVDSGWDMDHPEDVKRFDLVEKRGL